MSFFTIVGTELAKLRRSKVTWVSFAVYSLIIAMLGFFMWMMANPGMAASLGLIGTKATLAIGGQPLNWTTFLSLVVQMSGMGGMVLLAFIVAFIFGREYAEGTAKNMLALPIPRQSFVLAKLLVAAIWIALLTIWIIAFAYIVGSFVGLPGLDSGLYWSSAGQILMTTLLTFCLCPLVAWIAVATKGFIAPLGYAMGTLVVAELFLHTGWGPYCPWSIIALYTAASGSAPSLNAGSYIVITATLLLGIALTIRHEANADNGQ